jgi:hypothetical protein
MSNVLQLFKQDKIKDDPSDYNADVAIAASGVLALSAQLGRAVKELSKQFDAVDRVIDALGDTETRTRHKRSMKLTRKALTSATLGLSQQIRTLPRY